MADGILFSRAFNRNPCTVCAKNLDWEYYIFKTNYQSCKSEPGMCTRKEISFIHRS